MIDDVMVLQRDSTWLPTPCGEWSHHHVFPQDAGETWRTFKPGYVHDLSADRWAWLAGAISSCCPQAGAAIGPLLIGPTLWLRGERLPGMILVALSNNRNPLETAFHECMHEVWDCYLSEAEQGLLADHANNLPGRSSSKLGEEFVAEAFGLWAVGKPLGDTTGEVLALCQSIKRGEIGSRRAPWEQEGRAE